MQEQSKCRFEYSYESSSTGSFLVVSVGLSEKIQSYQVEMLSNNPNPNILPLDVRQKDNQISFYYTITSKLELSKFLRRKQLKRNEFIGILSDIVKVMLECKDYLLSDKCLLLDENYMYINPDNLDVSLVYTPLVLDTDVNGQLKDFLLRLIMYSVDIDESGSDNFLQRILGFIKNDGFNVPDFDKLLKSLKNNFAPGINPPAMKADGFQNNVSENKAFQPAPSSNMNISALNISTPNISAPNIPTPKIPANNKSVPSIPPAAGGGIRPGNQMQGAQQPASMSSNVKQTNDQATNQLAYKPSNIIIGAAVQLLMVGTIGGLALTGTLKALGDLPTTLGAIGLIGGAASFLLWRSVLDKKKMVQKAIEKKNTSALQQSPALNMEKLAIRNTPPVNRQGMMQPAEQPAKQSMVHAGEKIVNPQSSGGDYRASNDTTLLGTNSNDTEILGYPKAKNPYLCADKGGLSEEIAITKPNFIIGRMREQVDYVSQNNAVGKVHAEIISRGGSFFVKDLNSRNGTYLNGIRIDSNMDYEIKNNDKIVFANSEYTFIIP